MRPKNRLQDDHSGTIMVIALFMATALVGCIWYMFGLGEAMVYRQQLRAAADATAFASAAIDAVGMNIISMTNIAMAVVLSVLLILQIIFIIGLIVALVLIIGEFFSLGADTEATVAAIDFDVQMFNVIQKVQEPVFITIAALNVTAGIEGLFMPWVSREIASQVPSQYKLASKPSAWQAFEPFSVSLMPTRLPGLFNFLEATKGEKMDEHLVEALAKKSTLLRKMNELDLLEISPTNALKTISKYGLPVNDDTYPVLCEHAAHEVVQEVEYLGIGAPIRWLVPGAESAFDLFGYWFGKFVGQFPGIFCSGVDPELAIENQLGVGVDTLNSLLKWWERFSLPGQHAQGGKHTSKAQRRDQLKGLVGKFSDLTDQMKKATYKGKHATKQFYKTTMFPMVTFLPYENGNVFGQIWASIDGDNAPTLGAITGVGVAAGGSKEPTEEAEDEKTDYSEAEFYYECGPKAERPSMGRSHIPGIDDDSSGDWHDCRPNAMWNMFWRARLVRWHPAEFDVAQIAQLMVFSGAIDGTIEKLADKIPFADGTGGFWKRYVSNSLEGCAAGLGKGHEGKFAPGHCPFPTGNFHGFGTVTVGDEEEVFH